MKMSNNIKFNKPICSLGIYYLMGGNFEPGSEQVYEEEVWVSHDAARVQLLL
jgi:hypothetical protein